MNACFRGATRLAAASVVVLLAACSTNAGDSSEPTSSAVSSSLVSLDSPSAELRTQSPSPEATGRDHDEIESDVLAAWSGFWKLNAGLMRLPFASRPNEIDHVATGVTRVQLVQAVARLSAAGQTQYGTITNHARFGSLSKSGTTATVTDCMDQSRFGAADAKTGEKRTVGVAHDNTAGTLVRGADGLWRVEAVKYLLDDKC